MHVNGGCGLHSPFWEVKVLWRGGSLAKEALQSIEESSKVERPVISKARAVS